MFSAGSLLVELEMSSAELFEWVSVQSFVEWFCKWNYHHHKFHIYLLLVQALDNLSLVEYP